MPLYRQYRGVPPAGQILSGAVAVIRFLIRRFLYMIFTVWLITLVTFAVVQLPPGDFVTNMVSEMTQQGVDKIDPAVIEQLRVQYGLNDPFYVQYLKWMRNIIVEGNFGYS